MRYLKNISGQAIHLNTGSSTRLLEPDESILYEELVNDDVTSSHYNRPIIENYITNHILYDVKQIQVAAKQPVKTTPLIITFTPSVLTKCYLDTEMQLFDLTRLPSGFTRKWTIEATSEYSGYGEIPSAPDVTFPPRNETINGQLVNTNTDTSANPIISITSDSEDCSGGYVTISLSVLNESGNVVKSRTKTDVIKVYKKQSAVAISTIRFFVSSCIGYHSPYHARGTFRVQLSSDGIGTVTTIGDSTNILTPIVDSIGTVTTIGDSTNILIPVSESIGIIHAEGSCVNTISVTTVSEGFLTVSGTISDNIDIQSAAIGYQYHAGTSENTLSISSVSQGNVIHYAGMAINSCILLSDSTGSIGVSARVSTGIRLLARSEGVQTVIADSSNLVMMVNNATGYSTVIGTSVNTIAVSNATLADFDETILLSLFVAPNGLTDNPGTLESPTTLDKAQTLLRSASKSSPGILRVNVRGGEYFRTAPLELTSLDTGTANNPIEYVSYGSEVPRIIGGVPLSINNFTAVTSEDPNYSRLNIDARSNILVISIAEHSANLGSLTTLTNTQGEYNSSSELFINGNPATLARYPKAVDPETIVMSKQQSLTLSACDLSATGNHLGTYTYAGQRNGANYYTKGSYAIQKWPNEDRWYANGPGFGAEQSWECLYGPVGQYGEFFVTWADGSSGLPGFLLVSSTDWVRSVRSSGKPGAVWSAPEEIMAHGFWGNSWWTCYYPVTGMSSDGSSFTIVGTPPFGVRLGQPFYFVNVLEELTVPGEYFIDRTNNLLYLYPPAGEITEIILSTLQEPVVTLENVAYTKLSGISFEAAKNNLVDIRTSSHVTLAASSFKNSGGRGLLLGGSNNLVNGCEFTNTGKGGIQVSGTNNSRLSLTSSGTVIQNNDIHHVGNLFMSFCAGIDIYNLPSLSDSCCGITIQNNEIHHLAYEAIQFGGNNHIIKQNYIHHCAQLGNDCGAIYGGRDWAGRGTVLSENLFYKNYGPMGTYVGDIYMDDELAGITVEKNIHYNSTPIYAIQHGGGRDIKIRYNIFYGYKYGVKTDNRGAGVTDNSNQLATLARFNYKNAPWSTAYPELAALPSTNASIVGTHWLQPEGSVLYGNTLFGSSLVGQGTGIPYYYQNSQNISEVDPLFVNAAAGNFALQSSSPVRSIPGFTEIDVTKIGIQI